MMKVASRQLVPNPPWIDRREEPSNRMFWAGVNGLRRAY
jgi:hypothetical protein